MDTGYLVKYHCAQCALDWSQNWSCACDDECPECGTAIEASDWELDGTHTQEELDAFNSVQA